MMLTSGDHRHPNNSAKEALKQAMVQHELIFRNQVRELHRLYWTQKTLMRELRRKAAEECGEQTEAKAAPFMPAQSQAVGFSQVRETEGNPHDLRDHQPRTFNFQLPADEYIRDDGEEPGSTGIKPIEPEITVIGLETQELNHTSREPNGDEKGGPSRSLFNGGCTLNARGVIDLEESLQLESNEETNAISSFFFRNPTGNIGDMHGSRPTIPSRLDFSSRTWTRSRLVPAENNLHAGHSEIWREQKPHHSGSGLKDSTSAPSSDQSTQRQISTACKTLHIDLNIAQEDESSHVLSDSLITFPLSSMSSSVHHGVLRRESSNRCSKESVTRQPDDLYPSSSFSGEKNADWLFHGCQGLHPCSTQASAQGTKVTEISWKCEHEAINKVHGLDSKGRAECYRITAEELCSASSGGVQNSMNGLTPSPTGLCKLGEENADSSSGQPHSVVHSYNGRQPSIVTFSNDIDYNNQHTSVGSTNLPPTVSADSDDKQANCDRNEEDTVSSHAIARGEDQQDRLLEEFPIVKNFTQTTENNDCSAEDKRAGRHGVLPISEDSATENNDCSAEDKRAGRHGVLPISEDSGTTRLGSSAAESVLPPSPETCDQVCLQRKSCYIGNPKPQGHLEPPQAQAAGADCMIAKAAEMLVSISLGKSAFPSDRFATVRQTELECDDRSDQPQYSSDSFESITLKLSETKDDEYSTPARSSEKAAWKDACGVKLRRGRGLRDFQKDVLPGLVSLSRHEIREDLHTIGHELGKNRSRQVCRGNWSIPIRSRTSRMYSVGRKR